MKKPANYEFKKWLCDNTIVGLRLHYYPVGVDTADTDWELTTSSGTTKRVNQNTVQGLVRLDPDWVRVLRATDKVKREVDEYTAFAKKEAKDLATYERLRKKFEE